MTKKEKFITQSIEKFGDKFDYSKVTDINNKIKLQLYVLYMVNLRLLLNHF